MAQTATGRCCLVAAARAGDTDKVMAMTSCLAEYLTTEQVRDTVWLKIAVAKQREVENGSRIYQPSHVVQPCHDVSPNTYNVTFS